MSTLERTYFFVRHARAAHQRVFRRDARGDVEHPLTRIGELQARAGARALSTAGATRIVSSSLLRARQTAELFARGAGIPYDDAWPELDEISPGIFREEAARRVPEWWAGMLGALQLHRHLAAGARGPSAMNDVETRIRGVLARLDAMPDPRVAIVTHGYWILLMSLIVPGRLRLRLLTNCAVTRVDADGHGAYRLRYFARSIRHLAST